MVVKSQKHNLPSFSRKEAALEKILRSKIASYNCWSVVRTEEREQAFVPNLGTQQWLRTRLKQSLSGKFSSKNTGDRHALFEL